MKSKRPPKNQILNSVGNKTTYKTFLSIGFLDYLLKGEKEYAKRCFRIAYNYLVKINKLHDSGSIYLFPILLRILKTNNGLTVGDIRNICKDVIGRLTKSIVKETTQYKDTQYDIEVEMVVYYSEKIISKLKNKNKK